MTRKYCDACGCEIVMMDCILSLKEWTGYESKSDICHQCFQEIRIFMQHACRNHTHTKSSDALHDTPL